MNRVKYIVRGILLLLAVLQLIALNTKTDDTFGRMATFKVQTINKVKADSLSAGEKIDLLINETTKFSNQIEKDSPQIRKSVHRLIGIVLVLILSELGFLVAKKGAARHQ